MSSTSLEHFQAWFAEALVHDGPNDPPAASTHLGSIAARGALDPAGRLRIYQEAFWIRMRENLEEDYPGVRRLLGAEAWTALVRNFITASPQPHPSLIRLGEALPAHLELHHPERPELASVAKIEWAKIEVRHAEASMSALSALPALSPEVLFGIRLVPSRAVRRLDLPCRAGSFLAALPSGTAPSTVEPGPETVIVVRKGFEIRVDPVAPPFAEVLGRLMAGAPLAEAIADLDPAQVQPEAVTQAFSEFLSRGYFERFEA